jgi:hypothetical protein
LLLPVERCVLSGLVGIAGDYLCDHTCVVVGLA